LANRLRSVLLGVIDAHQSAFFGSMELLNTVLFANEVVDYMLKDKKSGLFVKVDFEKAYNFVDWKYLLYMMGRVGFRRKWIWTQHRYQS